MAFAMNSGSEAVDLAIKIARKWGYSVKGIPPNEAMILTITGNYHGKSLGPLSGSSNQKIKNGTLWGSSTSLRMLNDQGFGPFMPGIGSMINGRKTRFGSLQDLEYAFKQNGGKIAGLIVECVQGDAGCLPASNDYLRAARALCKKYKVLFIADEIQTGFGRTGYLMSYDAAGIHPDMTILGKALTGGAYTMSMVLGCREAMGQLGLSEYVIICPPCFPVADN
jgi:ornithine--oxo-acid transaminase